MKIQPVLKYQRIIPAAMALLGGIVSGCDRQGVVGSVPNPNPPKNEPKKPTKNDSTPTTPPAPAEEEEEEMPQILGGDVTAEDCQS